MEENDIKYLNVNEKQVVSYCIPLWLRDEQIKLSTAKIKNRIEVSPDLREDPIAIVCYGPSLNDTWEQIRDFKYIITCSGAHKFLLDRGIIPTWHVDLDPRPHKVQLLGQPHKDVEYLIASTCHPNMFDALENYNVKLWHIYATEEEAYRMLPPGEWAITGGSSVGLRTMTIARFLGFKNLHIFGMDGCEGKTGKHAAFHPNQSQGKFITIYEGITYYTTPSILECARQTFHELNQLKDIKTTFYGEGLVQSMAKNYIPESKDNVIIAMRKPILISDEYRKLNEELHKTDLSYGLGAFDYVDSVLELYEQINAESILDYGCGKGYLGKAIPFPIWEYDPAIEGKRENPRMADLVVCIDVLEHIEPQYLLHVLANIKMCTRKLAYFVIALIPATKKLKNDSNTHLIVENTEWWVNKLSEFFILGEPTLEYGIKLNICGVPKKTNIIIDKNYNLINEIENSLNDIIQPKFSEKEYYDFIYNLDPDNLIFQNVLNNKSQYKLKPLKDYTDGLFNNNRYYKQTAASYDSMVILNTIKNISTFNNKKPKLCDIGCGIGNILYFANKIGYDVMGIEVQKQLEGIHQKLNIDVVYEDLFNLDLSFLNNIDVIFLYRPIFNIKLHNIMLDLIFKNTKDDVIIVYMNAHKVINQNFSIISVSKNNKDMILVKKLN